MRTFTDPGPMSHGSREMLEQELDALLRQRDQYSLALDASTDPQASVRLQRTLDRLEDEIQGLEEALASLPADPVATSVPPPDWEDEPATAIFDPDVMPAPTPRDPDAITQPVSIVPPDPGPDAEPPRKPSEEVTDPARPLYDIEEEMRREIDLAASLRPRAIPFAPKPKPAPSPAPAPARARTPEPGAAEPLPAADPTISVTPPLDSFGADAPTVMWQSPPKLVRTSGPLPDPLGPVVLDALEPPTGENPREEEEPPSDPFALPGARWGAPPPAEHPFGPMYTPTPIDEASPFGSTAVGGPAFDAMSVEVAPEPEWSTGSKIGLALVVIGFLAGVGWVLTQ